MGKKYVAYVGTYTHGTSKGIQVYDVNLEEGTLTERSEVEVSNASYTAVSKNGKYLYSIEDEGVAVFKRDHNGDLSRINSVDIDGMRGCFLATDVDGKYLYNRCHLIGYQLTAENANVKNLITGTRYLNVQGMLPFENLTADYIKETGNHVLYRVTPVFEGDNLVASGVLMEGESAEDDGEAIQFCVYVYNVQPGIIIDYATGDSRLDDGAGGSFQSTRKTYVLNTNSKTFHKPDCGSVGKIKDSNKQTFVGTREEAIKNGYSPCKSCNP